MLKRIGSWIQYLTLAPAFLPLLYVNGVLYPYITLKITLFRSLGLLVLAALIFAAITRAALAWERLKEWWLWIPGALLAIAYATSLIGIDFYRSFWSTFERGDGLLTLSAIVIFFYAIVLTGDERFLERLTRISLWIGGLVGLYALLQWLQVQTGFHFPLIQDPRGRVGATFGNAAFMASYLSMTLFLTLRAVRMYTGTWRYAVYASIALQILAIVLSGTRGSILALMAAAGCAALYLAWRGEGKVRTSAIALVVLGVVVVGLFITFRAQLQEAPIEIVRRLASISLTEGTVSSRLFLWKNIGSEALQQPLTGVGAEHVEYLFNKVYNPDLIVEEWFDRSHNAYIDYLAQFGFVGLLLYLALILTALRAAFIYTKENLIDGGLLALLIITYAVQNMFVFDTALSLWLVVAVTAGLSVRAYRRFEVAGAQRIPAREYLGLGAGALIIALLIPVSIQPLRANRLLADTYYYHVADVRQANQSFEKGLSLNTYGNLEYGYQAYQMYTNNQVTRLEGESRLLGYREALATLQKNFDLFPYDARTAMYLAHVLDLTPPEATIDEAVLHKAIDREMELSPRRLQAWYILANISLRKGDAAKTQAEKVRYYHEGLAVIEKYAQLQPQSADPRFIMANLYRAIGDAKHAEEWAHQGDELYRGRFETAQRAAKYYIATENWAQAARYLHDMVEEESDNLALKYDYAKTLFLSGDSAGAHAIYDVLKAEHPEIVSSDPLFVQTIEGKKE